MRIVFRNVHLSFQEYALVNLKYTGRRQKAKLLLFPLLFILCIAFQAYNNPAAPDAYPISTGEQIGLYLFITLLVVAMAVFIFRRSLRQRYDRTQFLQKPATYTFTDAGIMIEAPSAQGFNSWDTIDSLLLMKHLAVLTTRNFTVYFLDFRCLEASATQDDFLALLQQHDIPVS